MNGFTFKMLKITTCGVGVLVLEVGVVYMFINSPFAGLLSQRVTNIEEAAASSSESTGSTEACDC